jgi:rubrerythrin
VVTAIDGLLRDPLSRRRLLGMAGVGVAGASAGLLVACGDDTKSPNVQTAPDESDAADVELLNASLDLELMVVEAYKAGAAALRGSNLQIAKGFLEQEQAHADTLASAIRDAGGTPNGPKSSYDFPRLRSQRAALRFAVNLENTVIASYIDVLPKLSQGDLRATTAAIVTCEAEHIAVLLGALGEPQVPAAFVTGRAD